MKNNLKEISLNILVVIIVILGIIGMFSHHILVFANWYISKYGCTQDVQCVTLEPKVMYVLIKIIVELGMG